MVPRFFIPQALEAGLLTLPERAARHVQVLRLQPGDAITLFDGRGGEWSAQVSDMKHRVAVQVLQHHAQEREAPRAVTLALGMPANERMEGVVEKATELGAMALVPLLAERSVLRLSGERALKKQAHWQAIAQAACEQCGRNRVPQVAPVQPLAAWLRDAAMQAGAKLLLSPQGGASLLHAAGNGDGAAQQPVTLLSGPEGGLSAAEQAAAQAAGFVPVQLGARVLRADTAPLAALALLCLPH